MARGKTAQVRRNEAPLYLDKAVQFLEQGRSGLDAGRNDAALLDAIHAAISATDAVTTALAGVRSTDPDHQRAADELLRVCRSGGVVGLANWTPAGFVGQMLKLAGRGKTVALGAQQVRAVRDVFDRRLAAARAWR